MWRVVPGNGHAHIAQHLSYWAFDHGDADGSGGGREVELRDRTDLFPENRPVADYNFACFYARNGNPEDAYRC